MFFLALTMIKGAFSPNAILISLLTDSSAPNFSFLVDLEFNHRQPSLYYLRY